MVEKAACSGSVRRLELQGLITETFEIQRETQQALSLRCITDALLGRHFVVI